MWTGLVIGILLGAIAGAVAALWWNRTKGNPALELLQREREAERADLERRLDRAAAETDVERTQVRELTRTLAAAEQRNQGLAEKLNEQKGELEQLHARMTDQFKVIANDLLEAKGKQLNEQQQERLGTILLPLQERIKDFEKQVRDAYESEGKERHLLKSEVLKLVEQNQRLSKDADNLTKALKGDSQSQGAWGEMILEKLLESAGLMPGQEYSMQESTTLGDGSRLRPDAVVFLPEGKHLIIDSKVSLLHYEGFASSSDETERDRFLKLHVESLRNHARGLGEKDYTKLYGVQSVDFVLMFVPIEPAFLLALRERPAIFQEAYDRQVVMVTHSTLMATLRTIHGIWKNERVARNHMEIADRAGKLYEKFAGFAEDLIKVGKQLDSAQDNYKEAMNKLSKGPGNLVRQVELIKELGAKTNKSINPALLQRAIDAQPADPHFP
ncbi:MAG: DNA recombination protein RmuC [Flavobacteriales bacterium]|nr:DNA recombination protein RmuC [Flavobacteriales bacterium]MBK7753446.1 DNA recombination protein RmuC [Flavobacteriales bacterium]MBK9077119.1 DNA recombination protein RmuC [Flavobacteriales bacterium]MBK9538539.1 DNA recombination protein RmuC [Flavobacteriales bacterium]